LLITLLTVGEKNNSVFAITITKSELESSGAQDTVLNGTSATYPVRIWMHFHISLKVMQTAGRLLLADSAGIKHLDTISEMVANRSKAALLLIR